MQAAVSLLPGAPLLAAGFSVSYLLPGAGQWQLQGRWHNSTLELPGAVTAVQQLLQPQQRLVSSTVLHGGQLQGTACLCLRLYWAPASLCTPFKQH